MIISNDAVNSDKSNVNEKDEIEQLSKIIENGGLKFLELTTFFIFIINIKLFKTIKFI